MQRINVSKREQTTLDVTANLRGSHAGAAVTRAEKNRELRCHIDALEQKSTIGGGC